MAFQAFQKNVLGFVSALNQQSHVVNKSCLEQYLPIFPVGGFPIIQFAVLNSEASSYEFQLFDLNDNQVASTNINTFQFTILDGVPNLNNSEDGYSILTTLNTDWGVGAGCYYLCISFVRNGEVCRYYTNAFQLVDGCLHYLEFWNDCDTDGNFYANNIYRPRIYFDGNVQPHIEYRDDVERELLIGGCYRTEKANLFEEHHFNNNLMLGNTLGALHWAMMHQNKRFVCSNNIVSVFNNPQITAIEKQTDKQNLYNVSLSFEADYSNPQGCCEDYGANGIAVEPLQKPKEDCNPCIIDLEQTSATCDSVTVSIVSDYPVDVYLNSVLIQSNFQGNEFTFANLSPDSTGSIKVQSQCGSASINYQTTPNTLVITTNVTDIECGETTGDVAININGFTGEYEITVCDSNNNVIGTTTNIQTKGWIDASLLIAGSYTVKVTDENCTQQTTFEIQEACVCDYDYQFVVTNCSCDASGSIYIDDVLWTIGTGGWQLTLCDSDDNVIDTTDTAPYTFNNLTAGTYTLKITDENTECLRSKIVSIADTCECVAPDVNSIIYSDGNIIFPDTEADEYDLIIMPIAGNGSTTILGTVTNPSPDDDGFLSYGNKDIVCGTTYKVKIIAKCSVGIKNKTAESDWKIIVTEDCPPCGEQELDIVVNIGISGQFQVQGVPVNAPGALVEYSSNGSTWGTVSPLLSQTNCFSINAFSAANSNFYVFDDPTNTNNHCIAFELGSGIIDPTALADLQNCNEILRLQLIGTSYIFVLDPTLAIVTQPTPNAVHISYPKDPQTKYRSTTTVDLLNNLSTGATPTVVQTANTLQFRCCYITSYRVFVRMTYFDCPLISKCVFVYSNTDYNIEDVELDANGNVI